MKKIISVFLAVLMFVTMFPLAVFAEQLYNIAALPQDLPIYPDENKCWVIFNEGFRNGRLEISTFNTTGDLSDTKIVWDGSLEATCNAGKISRCKQYHYDDGNWIYDREYGILTDKAIKVFASNVNIYNNSGELIISATDLYNDLLQDYTTDKTLVMATSANFPPFEYVENGNYVGIDIEIAEKIAEKLHMTLEIVDVDFNSIINGVETGKYDIGMAGMTVTDESLESVNFSTAYVTCIQVVILEEESAITTLDDLKSDGSMKFGVQQDTIADIYASAPLEEFGYGEENVVRYKTGADTVQALKNGNVDAVIMDNDSAKSLVATNEGLRILNAEWAVDEYAIAIAKKNTALLSSVNRVLTELKSDGTIDKIRNKYSSANEMNTSGTVASGACGDNLTWTLYNNGELVISGTGKMYDYDNSSEGPYHVYEYNTPWINVKEYIKIVTFNGNVTSIGDSAFSNCVNLEQIDISDSITSIGDYAFYNCEKLKEIVISEKITSIGYFYVFSGCKNLERIIGSINFVGTGIFSGCSKISEITISDGVQSVEKFAFYDCISLDKITIPASVSNILYGAFSGCEKLNTVVFGGSKEQWNKIVIEWYNDCLTTATVLFDSQISENPIAPVTVFSVYFADYLKDYTSKIANVDMPCEALIAAGGMPSLTWNTVVESIKSLTNFKIGIDEKGYYEAILLDLLANTVTSVDYDKEMIETTVKMANMLTNYLVDKNVDVTKEKLDSLDLKNLQANLQDYLTASNIQITKECFDALIDGTESTAECLDKISTYAIAMQEGQHLVSALALMAEHSDYQPLTDCLNEVATLMNASPEEMAKTVAKKGVAAKTSQVVGDYILGVIKNIFPLETIKDIINIADYGCNLIFPTSTTSEQMYRIYTLYHIEDVTKVSFKTASNNYNSNDTIANAENVVSCYDMIVRVYEHQIAECNTLAELLYKKGLLNAVKNFFSTNSSYDYQNALDWVDSYNVGLDRIKSYKQTAYEERGLSLGLLQPVRFVGIADGKIMGYSEQFVETGTSITVPNYSILKSNKFLEKLGTFEGWYYDSDCTVPVWATSIQVNKPLVLYSKISTKNIKQLQIKCPVNVEIYDENNNMLLKIKNDVLVQNPANLIVEIEGSKKIILLPSDENYNIKLIATDSGTMNYSVTEIENGTYVKRFNFYDVSLYNGQEFLGDIESGLNVAQSDYSLTTKTIENKTAEITPNEVIEKSEMQKLNISVNCVGNGIVSGNMLVTQGDHCVFEAIPNEDSDFDGWYCDNELLSSEKYFSFIVKENMSLTAVFSGNDTHEHTFSEWVVVKAPTVAEEGSEERICSVCGEKETRVIAKLEFTSGDVNCDGRITAADARLVLRISAKLDKSEDYNLPLEAFDVTGDSKITAADARRILRIAAKLE